MIPKKGCIADEQSIADRLTDQKLLKSDKLKRSIECAKVTKQCMEDQLKRDGIGLLKDSEAREQVVAKWTECDAKLNKTRDELANFTAEKTTITGMGNT